MITLKASAVLLADDDSSFVIAEQRSFLVVVVVMMLACARSIALKSSILSCFRCVYGVAISPKLPKDLNGTICHDY
jgi:hypothetical protein